MKSKEEAISWANRIPEPFGEGKEGVVEVRPFFGIEDFEPGEGLDRAKKLGEEFAKKKK